MFALLDRCFQIDCLISVTRPLSLSFLPTHAYANRTIPQCIVKQNLSFACPCKLSSILPVYHNSQRMQRTISFFDPILFPYPIRCAATTSPLSIANICCFISSRSTQVKVFFLSHWCHILFNYHTVFLSLGRFFTSPSTKYHCSLCLYSPSTQFFCLCFFRLYYLLVHAFSNSI